MDVDRGTGRTCNLSLTSDGDGGQDKGGRGAMILNLIDVTPYSDRSMTSYDAMRAGEQ